MSVIKVDYGDIGGNDAKVLWENPSPTSNWTGGNITLADDMTKYEHIVVYCNISTNPSDGESMGTSFPPIIQPTGIYWMVGYCIYADNVSGWNAISRRPSRFIDNTTFYIGSNSDADQKYAIPTKIVGIKSSAS